MSRALRAALRDTKPPTEPRVPAAPPRARRARSWLPLLAVLVVVGAVIGVAVIALGNADDNRGRRSPTASPSPTLRPGTVRVPNTVGLSEADGEAAAARAKLSWTIRWQETDEHPPGIYDQEPAAGAIVDEGSRFTMYAYRPFD